MRPQSQIGYLAEPFVSILGEIHAREGVLASSTPMGSCLVIGRGANTLEAKRQVRLRQLISQDLADDISTDV